MESIQGEEEAPPAALGIIPRRVAAVAEFRVGAVPTPQFDQRVHPEIQVGVSVTGNLVIANGTAGTTAVGIDNLKTLGANAVGNVTMANAATGAGGTALTFGANASAVGNLRNSISGNLQITSQTSTGTRSVTMNRTIVNGRTGVDIYEVGAGDTSLTIGNNLAFTNTISKVLTVQDSTGSSAVSLQNLTAGGLNYSDLGGGTDMMDLADTAGTLAINGVTRIDTGAGSDIVSIATAGTAVFNDSVFIALGAGNDSLLIGPMPILPHSMQPASSSSTAEPDPTLSTRVHCRSPSTLVILWARR